MKELVETIAKALVDNPAGIDVELVEHQDSTITIYLSADPQDMGKVIGRHGKIANAIRSIVKGCAIKEDKKVNVEIVSNE
jgi:predicted RNA-binding protein YlqC (UPF0109 family)